MVLLNGIKSMDVYDMDTLQSVIGRVAALMKTLPLYLYFPAGVPTFDAFRGDRLEVENLLEVITQWKGSFLTLYHEIKDKIEQQNLDLYQDVLVPFVVVNDGYRELREDFIGDVLFELEQSIQDADIMQRTCDIQQDIWPNRVGLREEQERLIMGHIGKSQTQERLFMTFLNIAEPALSTEFELQDSTFQFMIELDRVSLLELFNYLQLRPEVPFVSIAGGFFKILKDFTPGEEWGVYLPDIIIMKVLQKDTFTVDTEHEDYTNVFIGGDPDDPDVQGVMVNMGVGAYAVDLKS